MTVAFRDARREDVPAIVALLADDALGRGREGGDLSAYLAAFDAMAADPANTIIVGEQAGRVVACLQLTFITGLSLTATRRAQVEGVRVASELRGAGVGAALMQEAERRARAAGCGLIQLTTNASRGRAHHFYERLGYSDTHVGYKKPLG